MAVELGDKIAQIGTGIYRLVMGKDVDITTSTELTDIDDADIMLVDEDATGTQASTKKATFSTVWSWIVGNLTGLVDTASIETSVPSAATNGQVLSYDTTNGLTWVDSTTYTHPDNHAISVITGLQSALDAKQATIGDEDLTIAMTDGLQDALNAKVDDSQVLTDVPATNNYTNTTYSIQDGELSQNNFTDADRTKLNNIEDNATADQSKEDINSLGVTAVGLTAGDKTIDGDLTVNGSINKSFQQFNLSFLDDISNLQHYLSWRDQYETSTNNYTDTVDTNYLVPANGKVKCVYIRVGSRTSSRTMTVRVYSQNAGFMQGQVQQEAEATSITSSDDFEVFAFYFDNAEHFQAGDSIKISVQDSADSGGTQMYNVTAVLEFDYTQMGRTTSGELS